MNFEKILIIGGYLLAVCAVICIASFVRSFVRFCTLLRVAHVDFLSVAKCTGSSSSESHSRLSNLVAEALADQATLLCHRGERLANHLLEDDDDVDARIMKRKLAFFKNRPDLFLKYRRLPYITYGWAIEDDDAPWPEKARQFEKDWEEIDDAFDVLDSIN